MAKKSKVEVESNEEDLMSIVEFSEDISSAEEPEPLPEGEYPAELTAAEVKTSATKGTRFAAITFTIKEEDYPADYDASMAPGGKKVRFITSLEDNPPARFRLRRFCEALGAPMSKRIDITQWIGLAANVTIKHDEYQEQIREQVSKVAEA